MRCCMVSPVESAPGYTRRAPGTRLWPAPRGLARPLDEEDERDGSSRRDGLRERRARPGPARPAPRRGWRQTGEMPPPANAPVDDVPAGDGCGAVVGAASTRCETESRVAAGGAAPAGGSGQWAGDAAAATPEGKGGADSAGRRDGTCATVVPVGPAIVGGAVIAATPAAGGTVASRGAGGRSGRRGGVGDGRGEVALGRRGRAGGLATAIPSGLLRSRRARPRRHRGRVPARRCRSRRRPRRAPARRPCP